VPAERRSRSGVYAQPQFNVATVAAGAPLVTAPDFRAFGEADANSVDPWRLLTDSEFIKILGWPGYRVYRHEIDESPDPMTLRRRKRDSRVLRCPSCGPRVHDIQDIYEREVLDLPCFEFQTGVIIGLYRIR
jgi:hypothetical protein